LGVPDSEHRINPTTKILVCINLILVPERISVGFKEYPFGLYYSLGIIKGTSVGAEVPLKSGTRIFRLCFAKVRVFL
jgi:hypothetical protein